MYVIHACFTVMYSLSSEGNEIMGENFFCVCRFHHTLATDILAAFRWKQGSNSTSKTNLSYLFLPIDKFFLCSILLGSKVAIESL